MPGRLDKLSGSLRRNAQRRTLIAGIAGAVLILAMFAATLWRERSDALSHARAQAENLALVAERDIHRNVELYSLSLQAMVDNWGRADVQALAPNLRRQILFDRSIDASYITSASILDAKGNIVANLKNANAIGMNFSDRDYFQSHLTQADEGLHISKPFVSRVDGKSINIALSRRLFNADSSFGGVAVLYLNVDYFRQLLQGLEIGEHGRTTIFGPRGTVFMTLPYNNELIGLNRQDTPLFRQVLAAINGSFLIKSTVDGNERLIVFRTVAGSDIKVIVAPAVQDIYAPWRSRATMVLLAAASFALGLIGLSALLGRELQARLRAEGDLIALANTDGLTGLSNRRALERVLAEEGNRARRTANNLCVLFADVDYFKRYNDSQGHPAGDRVLATVARALETALHRPGDHAGRYGGEEFLVVLAQTDLDGARRVAETIRRTIAEQGIPHPESPLGLVTISIGVAAMSQGEFAGVEQLVRAADAALYAAKEAGRNCVKVYDPATVTA